jgi:predicted O-linked N-acetylglucosamine transferase (SPINDLY family)
MNDLAEALAAGTRHHQAGQFAEAERIYRQILARDPRHPHALNQLGMLALQSNQLAAAVDLFSRALAVDSTQAAFHANLGEAFRRLNKTREAIDALQTSVRLDGLLAGVHASLGLAWQASARYDDAEAAFRRAIEIEPRSAVARFNLGHCLQAADNLAAAADAFREAIALDDNFADAHNNLGAVLKTLDRPEEAFQQFQTATRINPRHAAAHANLASAYFAAGQLDLAEASCRQAVECDPSAATAGNSLGMLLLERGETEAARCHFQAILQCDSNNVAAHLGLATVSHRMGQWHEAVGHGQQAVAIDSRNVAALNNLGTILAEGGRHDDAIVCFERAIEIDLASAAALGNLAGSLQALGRSGEAIDHHRRAVAADPGKSDLHSSLLYALNYHPDSDADLLFEEHRAWGVRHADPLTAASVPRVVDRSPERRLRVGYVSPHFKSHAVNFFVEPILAHHDHGRYEIFCYSDVDRPDETTARLRGYADQWREIAWLSDERVADQVREDQIDILVDLTGHISSGQRMLVFARKPAPIQVTYLGYQNTTGMLAMDYRLTDEYADPPGTTERWHTETLVRLPRTFFCYLPSSDAPPVVPGPCAVNGYVTFGSINNYAKVTPHVLATWAQILLRVPESSLLVRAEMTPWLEQHLRTTFAAAGVSVERLELVNRLPRRQYLELINRLDVALDPFPFNGHTTTCDCLWQGVPVVTLSGNTYVSRFGGSALATLGLDELIATTREQYVAIAAQLASDVARLQSLRSTLRQRMSASPLLDFAAFTGNLETEFRHMWRRRLEIAD